MVIAKKKCVSFSTKFYFYHCTVINIYPHFPFTVQHMQVPQILLHGNPLVCDCHLEWLPSINEYGMEANSHDHLKVMDLAELECQLSHEENNFEEFMLVSQVCGLKYILGIVHIRVCSKLGFQLGHYSCNNTHRRDVKKG